MFLCVSFVLPVYLCLCVFITTFSPPPHRHSEHCSPRWESHYDLCVQFLPCLLWSTEGTVRPETWQVTNQVLLPAQHGFTASPPLGHKHADTRVNAAAWGGRGCERSNGGFWFQNVSNFFYQKPFAKQENEPKPETVYRYSAWPATERWNGVYALELSSKIISKPKTKKTTNLSTDLWFVLPLLNLESTELRWFKPQRQII